ncbi:MAG: DsbA family protein [Chloroflexi bacterium]|nr:DsbA family protein [Chloroflexota bacterium]
MYTAAVLLRNVVEQRGDDIQVNWRYFSLEQVNQKVGPDFKVWEQPDDYPSKGLWAMRAAEAVRRHQGEEAFLRFHWALLAARHVDRKEIDDVQVVLEVARSVKVDAERLERDIRDRSILQAIARDHTTSVDQYGAFGTPTFVFPNGGAAYLKMLRPRPEDSLRTWDNVLALMQDDLFVGEVKRPQPPWPKGISAARS